MQKNTALNHQFTVPVTVIIPVYNAASAVQELIQSIEKVIPEPLDNLQFIISDDCSTDKALNEIYAKPFFSRRDVKLVKRQQNGGFVQNINSILMHLDKNEDVVLLNSDTKIYNEIFSVLQKEAYSAPNIASVTPLTNNGTIASLFNWPMGDTVPRAIPLEILAETILALSLDNGSQATPTGIGFCLYLRHDALNDIGLFDPVFGLGYCEETAWCCQAIKKGYRHLISCKAFVYHTSTQSFSAVSKAHAIMRNSQIINNAHQDYIESISYYTRLNPLKFQRIFILLQVIQRLLQDKLLILLSLQVDPDKKIIAGTERHVNFIQEILINHNHAVLKLFPKLGSNSFILRCYYQSEKILDEEFHQDCLPDLINLLETVVDVLHVHHVLYWPESAVNALQTAKFSKKMMTLHDLYMLCPSIQLLREPEGKQFCEVESDLTKCNHCLNHYYHKTAESIENYRKKSLAFLQSFDCLIFPSENTQNYFSRAFGESWQHLANQTKVQEHNISHLLELSETSADSRITQNKNNALIVFVGHLAPHKGSELILDAYAALIQQGFEVMVFGNIYATEHQLLSQIKIIPYQNCEELQQLFQQYRPGFVALPALWAESFCYAFYEALILAADAIPIVGPYGHPADIVTKYQMGAVMKRSTATALVDAFVSARSDSDKLLANKNQFLKSLQATKINYIEDYLVNFIDIQKLRLDKQISSLLKSLEVQDKMATERDNLFLEIQRLRQTRVIKAALKLQRFLEANRTIKNILLSLMNLPGQAMKIIRSVKSLKSVRTSYDV